MANPDNPTLLKPDDTATIIGNVLIFTFTVPNDTDNDKLVFRVELDTVNPISSSNPNYKKYESRFSADNSNNGKWEVKNGVGTFIIMPSGGVGTTYYGNDAKITLRKQDVYSYPTLNTTWYWQISASDNLGVNPLFNQFIFGQARFGSE